MIVISILMAGFVPGCVSSNSQTPNTQKVLNIGMILASGGLGDKSFNDSAYQGLLNSHKRLNIRLILPVKSKIWMPSDSLRVRTTT
jgi:basic membrane protein A